LIQDLPQHGSLSEIYLPRLIAGLHRAGFEGTVRVSLAETTKVVYFRHGDIASAASNADSDRLANILIRDGRLTAAQLDMAKARVTEGGSLGKTLIELGFLSPTELLQGARHQVREILASCFTLRHGTFDVDPGPLPTEVTSLGLPTRRLIFDSVLQASERETVLREVGSMETVYKPDGDLGPALDVLRLDPEMDRVARSIDGSSSLRDLSGRTSLDDFAVSRIVLALEVLGLAERIGTPLAEPVEAYTPAPPHVPVPARAPAPPEPAPRRMTGPAREARRSPDPAPADPVPADGPLLSPEDEAAIPTIGVTPKPPPEPEPPPIPAEDLPAFATAPAAEPAAATIAGSPGGAEGAGETWQIDPETGDRVRLGPVELTFDGEIVSPRRRTWLQPRTLASAAAALLGVALIAAFFAMRKGGEAVDRPVASRPAAPTPAAEVPTATAEEVPTATAAEIQKAPPPEPARTPLAAATPAPEKIAAATPPRQAAPTPPADGSPRSGSSGQFSDAGGYRSAIATLDGGDVAGAARAFQTLAAAEAATRVTLQLMVACVEETVKNARARSAGDTALFFVPYSLKGRACYRVCWGVYETRDSAREDFDRIPETLRPAGASPLTVPLAALASGH
jgi:hypothetical protein